MTAKCLTCHATDGLDHYHGRPGLYCRPCRDKMESKGKTGPVDRIDYDAKPNFWFSPAARMPW